MAVNFEGYQAHEEKLENQFIKSSSNRIPAGLEVLYKACRKMYPNQPNPLQVTAVVKFWLGGPDPLDYISMYFNPGNKEENIPEHWHYVSFGLSDLHGDGRVHDISETDSLSGFGFELTMRVQKDGEETPPTWPAALMQGLAKYIFQTDSSFCPGDHISWHCSLDNSHSQIQHMLIAEDPQLGSQDTPFGTVQFVQIVGLMTEELKAVQHWNGLGVLSILKKNSITGGPWLVTNMKREENLYDVDPLNKEEIHNGIEKDGSSLSGVAAILRWSLFDLETDSNDYFTDMSSMSISSITNHDIKSSSRSMQYSTACNDFEVRQSVEPSIVETDSEPFIAHNLSSLHLTLNLEAGSILPLALKGILKHGRHFTFKSRLGVDAVTLVSPEVPGAFVTEDSPYMVKGPWLQIFLKESLIDKMIIDLQDLADMEEISEELVYEWKENKLRISIISDEL